MAVSGSEDWKNHTEGKQRLKKKKAQCKRKTVDQSEDMQQENTPNTLYALFSFHSLIGLGFMLHLHKAQPIRLWRSPRGGNKRLKNGSQNEMRPLQWGLFCSHVSRMYFLLFAQ